MEKRSQDQNQQSFTPAALAALTLAVCVFAFFSGVNPLGIIGLPLAIIAAGINVLLALSFGDEKKKLLVLLGANLLPFIACAVILASMSSALTALFPLMLGMPIWLTVRMRQGRAISIMAAAVCGAFLWAGYFAFAITEQYGACNLETINVLLDESFAPVKQMLAELTFEHEGETYSYYNDEDIAMMIYHVKTLLLGVCMAMMIVAAYFATLAARVISGIFGVTSLLPMGVRIGVRPVMTEKGPVVEINHESVPWRIEIDGVTIGVYIAAYIASILFATSGDRMLTLYSVAQNLVVILSPGFLYCGLRDIVLGLRGKASVGAVSRVALIFGAILLFINPSSMVILLCALGVIVSVRENRMNRDAKKIGKE